MVGEAKHSSEAKRISEDKAKRLVKESTAMTQNPAVKGSTLASRTYHAVDLYNPSYIFIFVIYLAQNTKAMICCS